MAVKKKTQKNVLASDEDRLHALGISTSTLQTTELLKPHSYTTNNQLRHHFTADNVPVA